MTQLRTPRDSAQATHSGAVGGGDAASMAAVELADGAVLSATEATFVLADVAAAPTGCDLVLATPGTGSYGAVLAGDGDGGRPSCPGF